MGGYKIVDLKDTNLETTNTDGVTIAGIYASVENNHRKALLLNGIVIDGVEKANAFITATAGDNEYTISVYGHTITISSLDVVKITA